MKLSWWLAAWNSPCTQPGGSVPSIQGESSVFSSCHGPSQATAGHGKPSWGAVIPGMSHPDESAVSLLFFQAVVFFITETVLFISQPDLESFCMLRKEAYCTMSTRWNLERPAPAAGRKECSETIHGTAAKLWKGPEPWLSVPGWSLARHCTSLRWNPQLVEL